MTLGSAFITHLRLVLSCNRHNIASSPWGSIGVGGDIVVVELGRCTIEIVGVTGFVVVSSKPWDRSDGSSGVYWFLGQILEMGWGDTLGYDGFLVGASFYACDSHWLG